MRLAVTTLIGVLLVGTRGAAAEPATKLFDDALRLLDAGNAVEACTKLEAAVRLDPEAPGILLNLGRCHAQQHHVATALKWFRKAQTRANERAMAEVEAAAKQQTASLAATVPTLKIEVTTPQAGAAITLDGAMIEATAFGRIEVDAGTHVVELTGPELRADRQTIAVGDDARLQVVTLHAQRVRFVEIDRGKTGRRWAFALGGIGGVLLVAETVIGIVGRREFDNATTVAARQRWKDVVRYGGSTMFGLGCAAIATGVVLYLRAPLKERVEQLVVVPFATTDQLGVAVSAWF